MLTILEKILDAVPIDLWEYGKPEFTHSIWAWADKYCISIERRRIEQGNHDIVLSAKHNNDVIVSATLTVKERHLYVKADAILNDAAVRFDDEKEANLEKCLTAFAALADG